MGIYLVTIGAVDVYYRGNYAVNDFTWKRSALCVFAGFMSTFSGELSVLTLTVITIDRFIVIYFNSPLVKLGKLLAMAVVVFLWGLVFVICLVPCFNNSYFENFYGQSEMCLPIPLSSERQRKIDLSTEVDVDSVFKPVTFISTQTRGWEYSVFMFVGINGTSFLAIVLMYVWMFKTIKKTRAAARSAQMKKDLDMARRMFLIVGTDALCWVPIIGLALYCLAGNTLEPRVSCLLTCLITVFLVVFPTVVIFVLLIPWRHYRYHHSHLYHHGLHHHYCRCLGHHQCRKLTAYCITVLLGFVSFRHILGWRLWCCPSTRQSTQFCILWILNSSVRKSDVWGSGRKDSAGPR